MMKRRFLVLLSAVLLVLSLGACGGESKKAIDINEVAEKLQTEIEFSDKLEKMEDEMFDIIYAGFPADKVKNKVIYLSSSGGTAEEIACFEAVDEKAVEDIKKGIEDRLVFQRASFQNYVPDEVKRIDKAVTVVNGNVVVLVISDNPDKATEIIEGK